MYYLSVECGPCGYYLESSWREHLAESKHIGLLPSRANEEKGRNHAMLPDHLNAIAIPQEARAQLLHDVSIAVVDWNLRDTH